jgi:hypothetical protein
MAKEKAEGFKALLKPKTWAPSPGLVARVGVALVIWRLFTRYVVVPNQAKLPAVVRDNWPTPS